MFSAIALCACTAGCARRDYFRTHPIAGEKTSVRFTPPVSPTAENARQLPMFSGDRGIALAWSDLLDALEWADVVILGEQHDDAVGHAVQQAVVQDVFDRWPKSALSMEMLERDEQPLVDDYRDGIIDAENFAKLTFSEKWAGEGSWTNWYQPMIDTARRAGGKVVAANAPRRYVRLARLEGYSRLRALPPQRRRLFDLPKSFKDDSYRRRFFDLMKDGHGDETQAEDERARLARVRAGFRSQSVWDATMGASIAQAAKRGARKVVHLVGQFHSDFNGGTVQQLRARAPDLNILVISLQRDEVTELRADDRRRADIVIYTGKPPPKEDPTPEETPAEQPPPSVQSS